MKRKLITAAVCAAFALTAAGCTDSPNTSSAPSEPSVTSEQTSTSPADTSAAESTTASETQPTAPAEPTEITPTEEAGNSTEAALSTEEVITIVTTAEAEPDFPVGCTVSAAWADDFLEQSSADYIEAVADGGEVAARVLFTTDGAVRDFKVLALTSPEIDDNGNLSFETTPVCEVEQITADTPLVVVMSFIGDIPNYGISYDNGTGEVQRFTVSESGFDGSLILSAF